MMYTASSRVGNSLDHFKRFVNAVNDPSAPFDFNVRLLEQVGDDTHFLVEFPPARRAFFHYADNPSAAHKAYVTDSVLPWFYMKMICRSRGQGFDLSSMGGFYSTTQLDHRFAKDIVPNFMGNHEDIYFCQGYGMPSEWHGSETIFDKMITYINHYFVSTFNDSLPYYRHSMSIKYLVSASGDASYLNGYWNMKISYPPKRIGELLSQSPGGFSFTATQQQIIKAYDFMSGFDDWDVAYPKMFRYQAVLYPDLDRGGPVKRADAFDAFLAYYEIKTPDELADYISEGFANHYIDELDVYAQSYFNPHKSPHGVCPEILTAQQTLDVVNASGSLTELTKNSKPQDHPVGSKELRHFYFYWNGKELS